MNKSEKCRLESLKRAALKYIRRKMLQECRPGILSRSFLWREPVGEGQRNDLPSPKESCGPACDSFGYFSFKEK
jgi:hypothetical protein